MLRGFINIHNAPTAYHTRRKLAIYGTVHMWILWKCLLRESLIPLTVSPTVNLHDEQPTFLSSMQSTWTMWESRQWTSYPSVSDELVSVGHITISGCRSLSQSFSDTSYKPDIVENTRFPVGISMLSIIVPEIEVFPVRATMLLLPVAPCCRSHLGTLLWARHGQTL